MSHENLHTTYGPHEFKDEMHARVRRWGADTTGVADTDRLEGIETRPADLLEGWPRAVVLGVRLADGIVEPLTNGPTELYSQHYQRVNALLDHMATRLTGWLQRRGASALPLPASQILDHKRFVSYLSHKAAGIAAGVGWQGKSSLLVTPGHGPRVRLVTVLTNMDLPADDPLRNRCGRCTVCRDACPGGAIRGERTKRHFASREDAIDLNACVTQLNTFHEEAVGQDVYPYLCGVCVSSCPWGKRKKAKGRAQTTISST